MSFFEDAWNFRFLEELQRRPTLWKSSAIGYDIKIVSDAIWNDLGLQFGMDGPSCKMKWKQLRQKIREKMRECNFEEFQQWNYYSRVIFFIEEKLEVSESARLNLEETYKDYGANIIMSDDEFVLGDINDAEDARAPINNSPMVVHNPPIVINNPSIPITRIPVVINTIPLLINTIPMVINNPPVIINEVPLVIDDTSETIEDAPLVIDDVSETIEDAPLVVDDASETAEDPLIGNDNLQVVVDVPVEFDRSEMIENNPVAVDNIPMVKIELDYSSDENIQENLAEKTATEDDMDKYVDPDYCFLMSIIPIVKSRPPSDKGKLKSKIQQIIYDAAFSKDK